MAQVADQWTLLKRVFFAQSVLIMLALPQAALQSLFNGKISSVAPPQRIWIKDTLLRGQRIEKALHPTKFEPTISLVWGAHCIAVLQLLPVPEGLELNYYDVIVTHSWRQCEHILFLQLLQQMIRCRRWENCCDQLQMSTSRFLARVPLRTCAKSIAVIGKTYLEIWIWSKSSNR